MNKLLKFFLDSIFIITLWLTFMYVLVMGSCYFYVEEQYWVVILNICAMFGFLKDAREFIKREWK